jgi:glycine cleavage system aminomethyltransferase T
VSSIDEHLGTRRAAGLFDFSFMSLYEFSGVEALEGLQTRDLRRTAPGQIVYTLLLGPDGAVLIDATVWRLDERRFWLFTGKRVPAGGQDRSGEHAILALQGPASGAILARLIGEETVRSLRYFRFVEKDAMLVGRLGFSGELGYELLVPASRGYEFRQRLLGQGIPVCGWEAADSLRIESGYVLFDREIDGHANPRELGLERLVDDRNRRFPMRRKLVGLEILEDTAGEAVPAATVTSECRSPTLGKDIALAYTGPDRSAPGTMVRLAGGRAARVAALPFYDPERHRPRAAPI